jgi:hypothetical protein
LNTDLYFGSKHLLLFQIKWDNRFNDDNGSVCLVTVDGTDFRIYEQTPFDRKWWSHKFNGPGLRYEIAICIQTGWIVWVNGPYPPGDWPDLSIARDGIIDELAPGEKFLADGTYSDSNGYSVTPSGDNNLDEKMKQAARCRHEAVNRLFKHWGILERRFRHQVQLHGRVFMAIANLVQASIILGEPSFQVDYYDN